MIHSGYRGIYSVLPSSGGMTSSPFGYKIRDTVVMPTIEAAEKELIRVRRSCGVPTRVHGVMCVTSGEMVMRIEEDA